jgi:hypothetical protein
VPEIAEREGKESSVVFAAFSRSGRSYCAR